MRLIEHLTALPKREDAATHRMLPAQPADVPEGKVYVGADLGFVEWSGEQPRPGDLVIVLSDGGQRLAMTGHAIHQMREPLFEGGCRCACPGTTEGLALLATTVHAVGLVLAIDLTTKTIWQMFGQGEVWLPRGLAVNAANGDVWVLDDRSSAIDLNDGYWLHRYAVGAAGYARADHFKLTVSGFTPGRGNPLSYISGALYVTLGSSPAGYVTITDTSGSGTRHTLTKDGKDFLPPLVSGLVVVAKPKVKNRKYAAFQTLGVTVGLIEINSGDEVTRQIEGEDVLGTPKGFATVCQRLISINALYTDLTEV